MSPWKFINTTPACRRMHHIIHKHCIQFSQIHVTQRLSGTTGYSSPKHWILNRTFGHLAAQNSQQWHHHEDKLPNHGVHGRRHREPFLLGPHHRHPQHDGRAIFLWCTAQLSQHGSGTGEGSTLQGIKKENLQKLESVLLQKKPCHLVAQQTKLMAGSVSLFQLYIVPHVLVQPWTQLCCLYGVTSPGTERGVWFLS